MESAWQWMSGMPTTGFNIVPGLELRKQALTAVGGTSFDMAVAMMETESMLPSPNGYLLGDVDTNGAPKTGDAANFGIFKQNWLMIRQAWPAYNNLSASDWRVGDALNRSLTLDVSVLHASLTRFGDNWVNGHRQGETGLRLQPVCMAATARIWADIANYLRAVRWIQGQLLVGHLTDDIRFWDNTVPAI